MLWFFAFTSIGIVIFAFFLALKRFSRIPFLKILGGSILMGITGTLAFKAHKS